jgi:hypothetical protein
VKLCLSGATRHMPISHIAVFTTVTSSVVVCLCFLSFFVHSSPSHLFLFIQFFFLFIPFVLFVCDVVLFCVFVLLCSEKHDGSYKGVSGMD